MQPYMTDNNGNVERTSCTIDLKPRSKKLFIEALAQLWSCSSHLEPKQGEIENVGFGVIEVMRHTL